MNKILALIIIGLASTPAIAAESKKTFSLASFNEIEAGGHFELDVTAGSEQEITLIAEEKDLELVDVKVSEGTLTLETKRKGFLWSSSPGSIKVIIKTPTLRSIDVSGAGKLDLKGLKAKEFDLEISGAATARLSGKVEKFALDISGSGKVRAFELEAEIVEADVSGAGDVEIHASKLIDADVSGVGKLIYKGSPVKVMSQVSGVGNIKPRG